MLPIFPRLFLLLALLIGASTQAHAWGRLGHQLICDTTWTLLDKQAREAAAAAYRHAGYRSFADACNYADDLRSDDDWDWLRPWHYINVPRDATVVRRRDCGDRGCVMSGISRFAEQFLNSADEAERHQALLLLGHFVGDLHQPLHVSYAEDRGGNRVEVEVQGKTHNLHYVWDTLVISRQGRSHWRQAGERLRKRPAPDAAALKAGNSGAWAEESLMLTRRIYRELPSSGQLTQAYFDSYRDEVDQRLLLAGYRLADLVNALVAAR